MCIEGPRSGIRNLNGACSQISRGQEERPLRGQGGSDRVARPRKIQGFLGRLQVSQPRAVFGIACTGLSAPGGFGPGEVGLRDALPVPQAHGKACRCKAAGEHCMVAQMCAVAHSFQDEP